MKSQPGPATAFLNAIASSRGQDNRSLKKGAAALCEGGFSDVYNSLIIEDDHNQCEFPSLDFQIDDIEDSTLSLESKSSSSFSYDDRSGSSSFLFDQDSSEMDIRQVMDGPCAKKRRKGSLVRCKAFKSLYQLHLSSAPVHSLHQRNS
jgi:hypothetical protein